MSIITDSTEIVFQFGLPKLARIGVIDPRNQPWTLGTFVTDDLTFMKAGTGDKETLVKPIELLRYYNDSLWPESELSYGIDLATLPLSDSTWEYLIDAYKSLLGSCTYECNKATNCKYGYAASKFLDWNQQTDSDHTDADIIETFQDQDARSRLIFKCYKINDEITLIDSSAAIPIDSTEPILLDLDFKISGTYQWKALLATKNDPNMVFSHYWKNDPDNYEPEGYCEECTLKYGLPSLTFDKPLVNWNVGTFAADDLIMRPQRSTKDAKINEDSPLELRNYITMRSHVPMPNNGFPPTRTQASLPSEHWTWQTLYEGYRDLLLSCQKFCEQDANCKYAYSAVKFIWYHGPRHLGINALLEYDIIDQGLTKDNLVYKCYAISYKNRMYIRSFDPNYTIAGTTQIKTKNVRYTEFDKDTLFSHYWTKLGPDPTQPVSTGSVNTSSSNPPKTKDISSGLSYLKTNDIAYLLTLVLFMNIFVL